MATSKGEATRERMIEAGIERMRAAGLAGAGINDIVAASGAPKGSVYHFFPGGKRQIVVEALGVHAQRAQAFVAAAMDGAATPAARVRALFAAFAARLERSHCRRSCPLGTVSLDLDDDAPDEIAATIAAAFEQWIDTIAAQLALPDRRRARSLAGLALTAIEGAYVRGRAERSGRAFTEAGRWLAQLVESESARN